MTKVFTTECPTCYCNLRNKIHWNSVKVDGNISDDMLKVLLDKSYALVLQGFSKKKQAEILQ